MLAPVFMHNVRAFVKPANQACRTHCAAIAESRGPRHQVLAHAPVHVAVLLRDNTQLAPCHAQSVQ